MSTTTTKPTKVTRSRENKQFWSIMTPTSSPFLAPLLPAPKQTMPTFQPPGQAIHTHADLLLSVFKSRLAAALSASETRKNELEEQLKSLKRRCEDVLAENARLQTELEKYRSPPVLERENGCDVGHPSIEQTPLSHLEESSPPILPNPPTSPTHPRRDPPLVEDITRRIDSQSRVDVPTSANTTATSVPGSVVSGRSSPSSNDESTAHVETLLDCESGICTSIRPSSSMASDETEETLVAESTEGSLVDQSEDTIYRVDDKLESGAIQSEQLGESGQGSPTTPACAAMRLPSTSDCGDNPTVTSQQGDITTIKPSSTHTSPETSPPTSAVSFTLNREKAQLFRSLPSTTSVSLPSTPKKRKRNANDILRAEAAKLFKMQGYPKIRDTSETGRRSLRQCAAASR